MRCPVCDVEMNLHAEKPIRSGALQDEEAVAAIHCCPGCGKVEAEIRTGINGPARGM